MVVKYFADDGTEFKTIEECFGYEYEMRLAEGKRKEDLVDMPAMFNCNGEKVNDVALAAILFVKNREQIVNFITICYDKDENCRGVDQNDCWDGEPCVYVWCENTKSYAKIDKWSFGFIKKLGFFD